MPITRAMRLSPSAALATPVRQNISISVSKNPRTLINHKSPLSRTAQRSRGRRRLGEDGGLRHLPKAIISPVAGMVTGHNCKYSERSFQADGLGMAVIGRSFYFT